MQRILQKTAAILSSMIVIVATAILVPMTATADARPADPLNPLTPATVTADALPTTQINGVVWSQVVIGNTVYAGGSFTNARPAGAAPGTQTVTRNNLLAYDIVTGDLIANFAPSFNGQVLTVAASPDGNRLYVGGEFTTLNGEEALRMVALDPLSGDRISSFDPQPSNSVRAIVATDSTVYFGGSFFRIGSAWRDQVAAVRASDATVLAFRPVVAGGQVNALALSPDGHKLALGGQFSSVNGTAAYASALAVVNTQNAEKYPYPAADYVRNGVGGDGAITALASDSTTFYGSGFTFGRSATLEGIVAINWADLDTRWIEDCHGDTYSVYATGSQVYLAGHPHYCGNVGGFPQEVDWTYQRAMSFSKEVEGNISREIHGYFNFEGLPHPKLQNWFPAISAGTYTGQGQGPWSVAGNADYVVYGGEFQRVNYKDQQGLVRFAVSSKAPNLRGPEPQMSDFLPTLSSSNAGEVRVRWQSSWDQDDTNLTYKVIRDGDNTNPIHTVTQASVFWMRPGMTFTDTDLTPGSTHTYRIFASDPSGRETRSGTASITVASVNQSVSTYERVISGDKPVNYWSVKEASGKTIVDQQGTNDLTLTGNASLSQGTTISGGTGTAIKLGTGNASNSVRAKRSNTFSTELWFKASSSQRGRLIGYGNAITGNSSDHDRLTYLNSTGRLTFGVMERGTRRTITSNKSYTDNRWHHVVSTLGTDGMKLYVDGQQVATRASTTTALELDGFWRLGQDSVNSWASAPSSGYAGLIDEVAIYDKQISAAAVTNHYNAGIGQSSNIAPNAQFVATSSGLEAQMDASASVDPDGSIAGYAWDFGDGTTGTGANVNHEYTSAGTYTVELTVTDNKAATGNMVQKITVKEPNRAPLAAFSLEVKDLQVVLDASESSDPDNDSLSYTWDFGDGSPEGSGVVFDHKYAMAGEYQIKLTVTDPENLNNTITRSATATQPVGPLATDSFERTVSGNWGAADNGGTWIRTGSAATANVGNGVGKLLSLSAGSGPGAYLSGIPSTDAMAQISVSLDKQPTGGGTYLYLSSRYVTSANQYQMKLQVTASGSLILRLCKVVGGVETVLSTKTLTLPAYQAGDKLELMMASTGSGTTELASKVWVAGTTEPSDWDVTAHDSEAGLQEAAGIGVRMYLSGSSTNAPVTGSFDDLVVNTP